MVRPLLLGCALATLGAPALEARQTGGRELYALLPGGSTVLPGSVRVLSGGVQIVEKDGVRMLKASSPTELLFTLSEQLPPDFTLEFDIIPKHCCNPEDLAVEGTATLSRSSNSAQILWHRNTVNVMGGGLSYQATTPADIQETTPGQLTTIVITVEGETVKLYTNGRRLSTLTERRFARGRVLRVFLGGQDDGDQAVYLARVRVSAGALATSVVASTGSASTGVVSSSGSTIRSAGTGTIATASPAPATVEAVTAIQPTSATAMVTPTAMTPRIGPMSLRNNTTVQFDVLNVPEEVSDAPQWKFYRILVERRLATDPDGCPAVFTDPADPARCYRFHYPWPSVDDGDLEPGGSYVYRVASVYSYASQWVSDNPDKLFVSLPVTFTPPATLIGRINRTGIEATSVQPQNVVAKGLTKSTVLVSWTANGLNQENPQARNEIAWEWMVDSWVEGTPSTCPAPSVRDKVDATNCTRLHGTDHSMEAWVESGVTHKFRVTSVFKIKDCNNFTSCVPFKYYPAEPIAYTAPVYFTPERPAQGTVEAAIPKLFLQARQGKVFFEWGCDPSWGMTCGKRNVDFAWAPTSNAVGYVLTVDEIDYTYGYPDAYEIGTKDVPAGPAPEARFVLKAGSTARACLAIVRDPAIPPDPRKKGECIEIDIEP